MGEVVNIEEAMPHMVVIGRLNQPHIIPVEALIRMANGKNQLITESQKREDIDLLQGIITEWLQLKGIDI